jgi:hypothetical protein
VLPEPFIPRVWVEKPYFERAKLILEDYQRRSAELPVQLHGSVERDGVLSASTVPVLCETEHPTTFSSGHPAEQSIYSGLIERELGKKKVRPRVLVRRFTSDSLYQSHVPPDERPHFEERAGELTSHLPSSLVDNYRAANLPPVELLRYFEARPGLRRNEESDFFELDHSAMPGAPVERHSAIYFMFSGIGFRDAYALLSHGWYRGSMNKDTFMAYEWGQGFLCLLGRTTGKWSVLDERRLWMS